MEGSLAGALIHFKIVSQLGGESEETKPLYYGFRYDVP